jgi:hypothetical protein
MHSEDELVAALQQHVLGWNRRSCLLQQHPMYGRLRQKQGRQQQQQEGWQEAVPASRRALRHAGEQGERQQEGWQLLPGLPYKPRQRQGGVAGWQEGAATAAAARDRARARRKLAAAAPPPPLQPPQGELRQRQRALRGDERVMSLLAEWLTKGESNASSVLLGGGAGGSRIPATPCRDTRVLFDFAVMEGGDMSLEDQVHVLMRWVGGWGAAGRQALIAWVWSQGRRAGGRCGCWLRRAATAMPVSSQPVQGGLGWLCQGTAPLPQVRRDRGRARRSAGAAALHAAG